ncbi:hypothetical protein HDU86_005986 [Geranomyces michiganensis]|nr:hypothetical protein HDU86_005986 [Geranomyces michiganensis]
MTEMAFGCSTGWDDEGSRVLTREALTAVLKACPGLLKLTIFGEDFEMEDDVYDGLFATLANYCPKLQYLNMAGTEDTAFGPCTTMLENADFRELARLPCLVSISMLPWKDMTAQQLLELTHVPASVKKREVNIWINHEGCPPDVIVAFLEGLVAQCAHEAADDGNEDTDDASTPTRLPTGGKLELCIQWEDDEDDAREQALPLIAELNAHVATQRRFKCDIDEELNLTAYDV